MKNRMNKFCWLWMLIWATAAVRSQSSWIEVRHPAWADVLDWTCETITWKSSADIQYVVLDYSIDNGAHWTRVPKWGRPSEPCWNDGASYWNPPWVWTKHALVRVMDRDNPAVFDISEYFTIMDKSKPKALNVVSPAAGDVLYVGSTTDIIWEHSKNFWFLNIDFSSDGGQTWQSIRANANIDDTPLRWRVPTGIASNQCVLRFSQMDDFPISVLSGVFEVRERPFPKYFTDVTPQSGIALPGASRCASWVDLNGDDWEDLFVTALAGSPNVLYTNLGNRSFSNTSLPSSVTNLSDFNRAGVFGDVNGDGRPDLYLGAGAGFQDKLLLNNGGNQYVDVTDKAGIRNAYIETNGVAFLDYDRDGDLDIFVCRWETSNSLYRNNGDGTFTDAAESAGVAGLSRAPSSAVAVGDYNNDGLPDLYVVNSMDGVNVLYQNNGNGTFSDVTMTSKTGLGRYNKSAEWGDFNNDRLLDLFVVGLSGNLLLMQNPDGTFLDDGNRSGVSKPTDGYAMSLADFDCDGFLDVLTFIRGSQSTGQVVLYLNNGDGTFSQAGEASGFLPISEPRGAAVGDYDQDGDLDVFITDEEGSSRLYENKTGNAIGNHWIKLRLHGAGGNGEAIGARVLLVTGERRQVRELQVGTGYGNRNSTEVHFGLGANHTVDELWVVWPSGGITSMTQLEADSTYIIWEQGENPQGFLSVSSPAQGTVLRAGQTASIQWQTIGKVDSVALFFSTDGGSHWNPIGKSRNLGALDWVIPAQWISENARIRIENSNGGQPCDSSGVFVVENDSISVNWSTNRSDIPAGETAELTLTLADSLRFIHRLRGMSCLIRFSHPEYVRLAADSFHPGSVWGDHPSVVFQFDSSSGEAVFTLTRSGDGFNGFGGGATLRIQILPQAPADVSIMLQQEELILWDETNDTIPSVVTTCSFRTSNAGVSVWPGDTNNDGTVNQDDIIPLGVCYGVKGPSRSAAVMTWEAQIAAAWSDPDALYADANGDGIVDDSDLEAIGQNWGKVRGTFPPTLPKGEMPSAMVVSIRANAPLKGKGFISEINLTGASGITALSCIVRYYSDKIVVDSARVDSLWRPAFASFCRIDSASGSLRIGLFRRPGFEEEGAYPGLLTIWARVKENVPDRTPIVFRLDSVCTVNALGQRLLAETENGGFMTDVEEHGQTGTPKEFRLYSNYPNPFNPSTAISYDLPTAVAVNLSIYDATGKWIKTLVEAKQESGKHVVFWDGKDVRGHTVASGLYFYRLAAGSFMSVGKCLLIK